MNSILPPTINMLLNSINISNINELRIRINQPLIIRYKGICSYYGQHGITDIGQAYIVKEDDLSYIVNRICKNSVYAYQEQMKKGYIYLDGGYRIGICGDFISDDNGIRGIRKITSINIRIPHLIRNRTDIFMPYINNSMLIIGPCGSGKTTLLRDLAITIGESNKPQNIIILDERYEIGGNGKFIINGSDIITNCPKKLAFENIIRSMYPDIIIMDEIFNSDYEGIELANNSGIKIFASMHAPTYEKAIGKLNNNLKNVFNTFIVLSDKKYGYIEGIYDKQGNRLR